MLNAAQREKCRAIAAALDRGDMTAYRRAADSLTPEMRGLVWDLRAHVIAQAGRGRKKTLLPTDSKVSQSDVMHDLDYWGDDTSPEPDDGDDVPCPTCNGRGKDSAGNTCAACGGSGKAPLDDGEESEGDDHDFEDEN